MDSIAIHMCLIFIFKFVQIMTKFVYDYAVSKKKEEEEEEGMLICQRTTKSKIS